MTFEGLDFQLLPAAVLSLSQDGAVLDANVAARNLLGERAHAGARSEEWFPPGDRGGWAHLLSDSRAGTPGTGRVLRLRDGTGSARALQWAVRWFPEHARFLAVAVDVSDWSSRERCYEQILDCIADYVLVKSEGSRLRWANRAFREYYGMTNEQLQLLLDAPFNEPDYTKQYVLDDLWVWTHKRPLHIDCEPVTRHDGAVRRWRTTKSPVLDEQGKVAFTVGVSQDITEQLEAEERAVNAARLAALGEMAGGIAHEINNPLSVILARSQLLRLAQERGTLSPEQLRKALETIENNGTRIVQIVRGLRRLSRDGSADPFQEVSLASIFQDTLALCRARFHDAGIALRLPRMPPDLRLRCRPVQNRAGPAQPPEQRTRCRAGRPARRRTMGGGESPGPGRVGHPGDPGAGLGPGRPRGAPDADHAAVLHDQAAWAGDRARLEHLLGDRQGARRQPRAGPRRLRELLPAAPQDRPGGSGRLPADRRERRGTC
ncbi:MAG: PAS domain-containing protein [Myxococcales bacterium]